MYSISWSSELQQAAPSYRALLTVPGFARLALATLLGRLCGQMWYLVLVLFVLVRYHSATLAGAAVLLSIFPGLVFSPIAGALLDRQGRVRLMILDYSLTAAFIGAIAILSLANALPAPLMLALVTVIAVSNILSITGSRSLFPLMVPRHLWDRANGIDTSSYSLTAIVGPALAGLAIAKLGPEAALLATAAEVAAAAVSLIGVADPIDRVSSTTSLVGDARAGLSYVLGHPSLRGLAITMFISNIGFGILPVGIPLLVLRRLHGNAATVGQVFAAHGLAGLIAGLLFGRVRTDGRERVFIALCQAIEVPTFVVIALTGSLPVLFLAALVEGATSAVANISIFALRQRRTDPAWFGRAFAVSMSLNIAGEPIGSALSGPLLERSLTIPLLLGAGIVAAACVAALVAIPKRADPSNLAA